MRCDDRDGVPEGDVPERREQRSAHRRRGAGPSYGLYTDASDRSFDLPLLTTTSTTLVRSGRHTRLEPETEFPFESFVRPSVESDYSRLVA